MKYTVLHKKLDSIFEQFHKPEFLRMDPLLCVHKFKSKCNREVAGLVAAVLAYGRAEIIIRNANSIFEITGQQIVDFALKTTFTEKQRAFKGFKHRFNDDLDIAILFQCVSEIIEKYGSLEGLFLDGRRDGLILKNALEHFTYEFKSRASRIAGASRKSFEYLFPSPSSGSACKRLNMFLRWMVRADDSIDLGIWKNVSPSLLIIPVDTHVAKIARDLKLCSRKIADWRMAEEITDSLRKYAPEDPVKYDFSLCRVGMVNLRRDVA